MKAIKEILCREDANHNQMVFVLDTLDVDKQTISVWKHTPDTKLHTVTIEYFRSTNGLKGAQELGLATKFSEQFDTNIALRRRLFKVAPPGMKQGAYNDEHFDRGVVLKKLAEIRSQVDQLTSALAEAA